MRTLRSRKLRRQVGRQGYGYQVQTCHRTFTLGVKAPNKRAVCSRQLLTTKTRSFRTRFPYFTTAVNDAGKTPSRSYVREQCITFPRLSLLPVGLKTWRTQFPYRVEQVKENQRPEMYAFYYHFPPSAALNLFWVAYWSVLKCYPSYLQLATLLRG